MIKKINHIGIAVKNVDEVVKIYSAAFGIDCESVDEVDEQKVKLAFLPIGDTRIELLEGTSEESHITKFINKSGEGIHHIAFQVENIENALQQAKEQGLRLIDEKPRIGAHKTKIAFIHPKSTNGVLFEFIEATD